MSKVVTVLIIYGRVLPIGYYTLENNAPLQFNQPQPQTGQFGVYQLCHKLA